MYVMGLAKRRRCWETERSYQREAPFQMGQRSRVCKADENLSECGCNEENRGGIQHISGISYIQKRQGSR